MENLQIVPVIKNVEAQYVEMKVPLYSYGCERKVKKALAHIKGIYSVNIDNKLQKVTVWGICNRDVVLATIRKKRKDAHFWGCLETDQGPKPEPMTSRGSFHSWKAWRKFKIQVRNHSNVAAWLGM